MKCKFAEPLQKSVRHYLKKMVTDLPPDPAIPLLGINSKDMLSYYEDTGVTRFIAVLFIKTGEQTKCTTIRE